ncbi:MAG: hypothetical protein K6B41_10240, partial [Butyrivibrio sp.]|nr:hypothetical protein [Butyrivibrio sp.]
NTVMTDEEKERIKRVIEEKNINLGINERLRLYELSEEAAMNILSLKEGYAPDLEFTDDETGDIHINEYIESLDI